MILLFVLLIADTSLIKSKYIMNYEGNTPTTIPSSSTLSLAVFSLSILILSLLLNPKRTHFQPLQSSLTHTLSRNPNLIIAHLPSSPRSYHHQSAHNQRVHRHPHLLLIIYALLSNLTSKVRPINSTPFNSSIARAASLAEAYRINPKPFLRPSRPSATSARSTSPI